MKKRNWMRKISMISLMIISVFIVGCTNQKKSQIKTNDTEYAYKIYCTDNDVSKLTSWGMDIDEESKIDDKLAECRTENSQSQWRGKVKYFAYFR